MSVHDRPARLLDSRRFLSREECDHLADRILAVAPEGETHVSISSWWRGELRWARNRVSLASDRRSTDATVTRVIHGAAGHVEINQFDERSIVAAVHAAERIASRRRTSLPDMVTPAPTFDYPDTKIWSDVTYNLDASMRGAIAERASIAIEQSGMLGAGYLEVGATGWASIRSNGLRLYSASTRAQCSMTVREPHGRGSGWAGLSSYAWNAIDPSALTERSLRKCLASRDPVAVEPGRYTVILEPQAVSDLLFPLFGWSDDAVSQLDRQLAEGMRGLFASGETGRSKLGMRVVSERVTVSADPRDPELGVRPFAADGEPYVPVTWIDRGILTALSYNRGYALSNMNENVGMRASGAFRMAGEGTSMDDMIRTTQRGLIITRLSDIDPVRTPVEALMLSAYTRDGVWLVERGAIVKPVKNFRILESPMFVLNNIEMIGTPEPTFHPGTPIVVPALKVRDFNCVALADAV